MIGSEVITPYGSRLDLLAIDADGNLNLLELKRDKTPREVVAQVLDYGSWASTLSRDDVLDIATKHLDQPFEAAFEDVFGSAPPRRTQRRAQPHHRGCRARRQLGADRQLPSRLRCPYQRGLLLVSRGRQPALSRQVVASRVRRGDGRRSKGQQEEQAGAMEPDRLVRLVRRRSRLGRRRRIQLHRRRWWPVFYSQTMRSLPEGARVWVNLPGTGFRRCWQDARPARFAMGAEALVKVGEDWVKSWPSRTFSAHRIRTSTPSTMTWPSGSFPLSGWMHVPSRPGYWEKGLFASPHSACKLRQEFTLARLADHFNIDDGE